jgi:transposase
MNCYVGVDVSLEMSSVCIVDGTGHIVLESKISSEPDALVELLTGCGHDIVRVGLEAGPFSQWLHAGLTEAGLSVVLLEARRVRAVLSAMPVKTDRNDARGIAQLIRMGWYRPVHVKAPLTQEVRALLTARKQMQAKLMDLEGVIRGILRGFGLKVRTVTKNTFEQRIRDLVAGQPTLERVMEPMLRARNALRAEYASLHRDVLRMVRTDDTCRRLMTVPGVGGVVAITFTSAVDDPSRFRKSKEVGAHFGLTPRKHQSGETDRTGRISKTGDVMVRAMLFEAANAMLTRTGRFSALKAWAMRVAKRAGMKKAKVALARKLAVVLHRMWVDGTEFRWTAAPHIVAA